MKVEVRTVERSVSLIISELDQLCNASIKYQRNTHLSLMDWSMPYQYLELHKRLVVTQLLWPLWGPSSLQKLEELPSQMLGPLRTER